MSTVTISIEELKDMGKKVLMKYGATEYEAEIITSDYLDADLRGHASHGFTFFKQAAGAFEGRGKYEAGPLEGSYLHIAGNYDLGSIVAREAIDLALPALPDRKIITIGITDVSRFNTAGVIARYGAERGAITLISAYGGMSVMAPPGGKGPAVNNTPLAIAIPHTNPLFVLDMAMSERAWGHLSIAKFKGETIPENWGVDEEGQPTENPADVKWLSPVGGYKGFGLSLALEIISGALVNVPIGAKGLKKNRGAFIQLIDPTIFGHTVDSFKEQVSGFLGELEHFPLAEGHEDKIRYPGQASEQRYQEALASGVITLHHSAIDYLRSQL
ncbi:Ldh family oxidoreductase [Paenibacillus luteus]|uniref:Ldh family oxidoreductase n=1 Tax=Paenibacillus luteus TaxID=2545753 RepID=UPI001141159E|nr:Ldh family oxidoreductase [Paenibacillus luteus]